MNYSYDKILITNDNDYSTSMVRRIKLSFFRDGCRSWIDKYCKTNEIIMLKNLYKDMTIVFCYQVNERL